MLRKLKYMWRYTFHYKAVFVTPIRSFTIEHRIGRAPFMIAQETQTGLRGQSMEMVYFDEAVEMTPSMQAKLNKIMADQRNKGLHQFPDGSHGFVIKKEGE